MQHIAAAYCWRILRVLSLVVLAVLGTTALMLTAPGFFADAREMDSQYSSAARDDLARQKSQNGSLVSSIGHLAHGWMRGDLGTSRQYDVPVAQLLRERAALTAKLIVTSLVLGWTVAFAVALPLASRRRISGESAITLTTGALLCIPVGVMATVCLVVNWGGPVLVLASLIAVRDFKLLYRMLRHARKAPQLLYARSQGYSFVRAVRVHLLRSIGPELFALLTMSFVIALSSAVPVEVIFDKPGLGQLAWSAAMNRDLPVLVAVTVAMAALVGLASIFAEAQAPREATSCV